MSGVTLWARRGAVEPHWQLGDAGPTEPSRWALLGWDADPDPVDGGVPDAVALAWSRALAPSARVSFLCLQPTVSVSDAWEPWGDDMARAAPAARGLAPIIARLRGERAPVALVCTRQAATIANAFGDAQFAWWLQSQVLLLSALDAPPPAVTPDDALALLDADWATRALALGRVGVLAVARPAVDGDAMGLLALQGDTVDRFIAALAEQAREAGYAWELRG